MTTNSCWDRQLQEIRRRVNQRQFWQDVAGTRVEPDVLRKNADRNATSPVENPLNSRLVNKVRKSEVCAQDSILRNRLMTKEFGGSNETKRERESAGGQKNGMATSKLVRFSKFNFVGGIGIVVQFATLFFLKSALQLNYLAATALAVEIAVLHNFAWHERFTWADRLQPAPERRTSGAKARMKGNDLIAALRRCATQNLRGSSFARLARFHLGNGAISILGNLALMSLMVGEGHMNYLAANAIAIALCSLANFLVSDRWVFES